MRAQLDTIREAAAHEREHGGALTVEHEGRRTVVWYRSFDGKVGGKWIGFPDDEAARTVIRTARAALRGRRAA